MILHSLKCLSELCMFFNRVEEPAEYQSKADDTIAQMSQADWETYWQSLSAEQQDSYRQWYSLQSTESSYPAHTEQQVDELQEQPASDTHKQQEEKQKALENQQKQAAIRERQLLAIQSQEVQNLEALLNKIDSAQNGEKDSAHLVGDGDAAASEEAYSQAGGQSWWQVMSQARPDQLSDVPEPAADAAAAAKVVMSEAVLGEEPEDSGSESTESDSDDNEDDTAVAIVAAQPVFATEYKEYTVKASFNKMTGKFQRVGGDDHWLQKGLPADRSMRQMAHHFDPSYLCQPGDSEEPSAKRKKLSYKEVKQLKARKKAQKHKALVKQYA